MNKIRFVVMVLFLGVLGCGSSAPPDTSDTFEGEWAIRELNENGAAVSLTDLKVNVTIKDKKYSKWHEGKTTARNEGISALRVDASKEPGHFDLVRLDGPDAGKSQLGLFVREGDKLTVALAPLGAKRLEALKPGPNTTYMVMERKP